MGLWHLDYLASKNLGLVLCFVCLFICVWKLPLSYASVNLSQVGMLDVSLRRQFYWLSFREASLSVKVVRAIKSRDITLAFSYCYCLLTVIPSNTLLAKSLLLMIRNWKDDTVMYILSIFFQWRGLFFKIFIVVVFLLSWGHLDSC